MPARNDVGVAVQPISMSDSQQEDEANPRPTSEHRTPREIARDRAGPTGPKPGKTPPVRERRPPPESAEEAARKAAVHKSAQASREAAGTASTRKSHPPDDDHTTEP